MHKLLLIAALACQTGDRPFEVNGKLPRDLHFIDLMITVQPFYSRLYIYAPGAPGVFQQCCGDKPTSILRVPVGDGRFCVRQSQPQMKWRIQGLSRPDVEM